MTAPAHGMPVLDQATMTRLRTAGAVAIQSLADTAGVAPHHAAAQLAAAFEMRLFETADMQQRRPAFDRLPLARAQQRHAVLLHGADDDGVP